MLQPFLFVRQLCGFTLKFMWKWVVALDIIKRILKRSYYDSLGRERAFTSCVFSPVAIQGIKYI